MHCTKCRKAFVRIVVNLSQWNGDSESIRKWAVSYTHLETGRNYIPGENELFGYEGEFLPYLQNEQVQEQEPHNFHITDDDLEMCIRDRYVVEDTGNFAQYGVQFDVFYGDHAMSLIHI